jgi:hypothetical protein
LQTKILSEPKPTFYYVKPPSLNETERKLKTDLINLDNRIMADRLKKVPPVIDVGEMKTDFERHLLVRSHMMKKFPGQKKKSPSKSGGSPVGSVEESSQFGMVYFSKDATIIRHKF